MPVAAGLERPRLGDARLLAQSRKRIELAEERDDGTVLACVADDGGRDAGHVPGHAESLALELRRVLGTGPVLGIAGLGHAPDAIAQRNQVGLLALDQLPDVPVMIHAHTCSRLRLGLFERHHEGTLER